MTAEVAEIFIGDNFLAALGFDRHSVLMTKMSAVVFLH